LDKSIFSGEQHYVLWVKKRCVFCQKAMKLLDEKGYAYNFFVLDEEPQKLAEVKEKYNQKTVPIIRMICPNGEVCHVGGYTDLEKHIKSLEKNND